MKLTDEQCNEFRRLPLSFNDMVRAIHDAGRKAAFLEAAEMDAIESVPQEKAIHADGCTCNKCYKEFCKLNGLKYLKEEIK